ncbi:hypothetical protein M3Y97_00584500 [Aphelenchoides bicaudatus]|nr:hypothetical protein M3Y97_00584500 [Aphelenchoides bicaudatus]
MLQQQQLAQQQLATTAIGPTAIGSAAIGSAETGRHKRYFLIKLTLKHFLISAAPWSQQAPGKPTKASNFYEIQEQERIESLRRQQAEEEKRRELEAIQKRTTNNVQGNGNPWNVVKPTTKPVPIPPAKELQQKQAPAKTVQKQSPVKVAKKTDPLTDWVIERIRQINPSVDSEVFATFLMSIESPNEVEDYILSCFGETKAAKQLHQEFLAKRIELRPRRGAKKEDDLSAPAQAITTENPSSSGTKGGKKSKKGKKVDVSAMMNFRPIGDASRFNAGEIDLELPAASKKGKKK